MSGSCRKIGLFLVLGALLLKPAFCGAFKLNGYFENRFFLLDNAAVSWSNAREKFFLGEYNRLRLNSRFSGVKNVHVNLSLDLFSFHGVLSSPLGTSFNDEATAESENVSLNLDRLNAEIYFSKFDITLGRQRVAMGVSYIWAPLDVFNRVNVFEPAEEKPGVNACRLYFPVAKNVNITGVYALDDKFENPSYALRGQIQAATLDTALTLAYLGQERQTVLGVDVRGENIVGWWIEYGCFISGQERDSRVVLGFDYTFPVNRGIYWLNEFYFDSGGEKNSAAYDFQSLLQGRRFTLGTTYFFSMLRYGFNDFWQVSASYIGNWGDGSYILNPRLDYDASESIRISSGLYLPMGNRKGEFNRNKFNIFFIWVTFSF